LRASKSEVEKVNRRWISSLVLSAILVVNCACVVQAALVRGPFTPCRSSQTATTASSTSLYCIQRGDTLWDISRRFQVDLQVIAALNKLDSRGVLQPGQMLHIPKGALRMHTICSGETLWDIAIRYGTSVQELRAINTGKDPRNLRIGDTLKLPDQQRRMAAIQVVQPSRGLIPGRLVWPLVGTITSRFGWRSSGFHHGVDIAGKIGDPIRAAASGEVSFTGYRPVYGRLVVVKHEDGGETLYAHLSQIHVSAGERVSRGQVIARVGNTGRSTGPHLHLELKYGDKNYDPLKYLSF